jgi:hypothetical protein
METSARCSNPCECDCIGGAHVAQLPVSVRIGEEIQALLRLIGVGSALRNGGHPGDFTV